MARSYVCSLAGGTATATIQMTATQTLKQWLVSATNAAAGAYELSLSSTSQIATAQPTSDVIARVKLSGTAGPAQNVVIPINLPRRILDYVYVHQTGTGNLGETTLS